MKAEEFDQKFDDGVEDIDGDLDLSTARRINKASKLLCEVFVTKKETPEQDRKKLKPKR
jgi:hypothetical protein